MTMFNSRKHTVLVGVLLIGLILLAYLALGLGSNASTMVVLVGVILVVVMVLLHVDSFILLQRSSEEAARRSAQSAVNAKRILEESLLTHYWQVEAWMGVLATIQPALVLPATRKWAASPDLLRRVVQVVLKEQPDLVVEASSGTSTMVIAYCLKRLGKGRVMALEHDPIYAQRTRDMIALHDLQDIATVVDAPLKKYDIGGEARAWYDLMSVQFGAPIDLLVIDGPPESTQPLARYPALPLLHPHFGARTTVLLDDGARADEKEAVRRWSAEFGAVSTDYLYTEKGAWELRFVR